MSRYFVPITQEELADKIEKAFVDEDPKNPFINRSDAFSNKLMQEKLGKDLKVKFDYENFFINGCDAISGYHTLSNGLTFLGCYAGGDWEYPVQFIIYWDGKKLRGYVPTKGNPWNTDTKMAYGNNDEADLKNARKRWPDCPDDLDGWLDSDDNEMLADIQAHFKKRKIDLKHGKM